MTDQFTPADPTTQHHTGDFGEQSIEHPGLTADMDIRPDHGEQTYRGTGRLIGKRAIVTGGDSGIGRAICIAFAHEGADVLIAYLDEEEQDAQETAKWIRDAGRTAMTMPGDIQDQQHCAEVVQRAVTDLGGVDILVNNAAYQMALDGIASLTTEQMERTYRTNVFAMIWLCQEALQHMQPGSSIINTSSIQASQPSPQLYDYATTKAAIVNFTKNLAQEVAERGIRVNSVAPGTDLDTTDPRNDDTGEGRHVRPEHTHRPSRPTRRTRTRLRLPRLTRIELHHRRNHRRHRRTPAQLKARAIGRGPLDTRPVATCGRSRHAGSDRAGDVPASPHS